MVSWGMYRQHQVHIIVLTSKVSGCHLDSQTKKSCLRTPTFLGISYVSFRLINLLFTPHKDIMPIDSNLNILHCVLK